MAEFYVEHEYWFAAIQLILAMLGMGATLTGKDFRDVVREPRAVSLGTAIQLVAVPVTAFLFLRLFAFYKAKKRGGGRGGKTAAGRKLRLVVNKEDKKSDKGPKYWN